jgi:hypothetical protein
MSRLTRRSALGALAALGGAALAADRPAFRLATFSADVTPPLGAPLLGGASVVPGAKGIEDPLFVHGFALLGGDKPVVVAAIDFCEVRNDAYDRWRDALAGAAGTTRERVFFSCVHQHDAPLADLEAQRILERSRPGDAFIDLDYHEKCVQRTAKALRDALEKARPVTHFGTGKAKVEKVASNRRFLGADGKPRFDRSSMSGKDPVKRDAPEGTIDPWLRTLSFWDGETPVCALHHYAVHPMSYWGSGYVSADFPGLARKRRQADDPKVHQVYVSGCSGNVTAGKYNDGSKENRPILADRLYRAMAAAWKATERRPLTRAVFRNVPIRLEPRDTAGFTHADLNEMLKHTAANKRSLAAMGLSWRKRADDPKHRIDLPVLDLGAAQVVLLPGESYVEFQLKAQELRPDSFVMAVGYGECATGYVPVESAWTENDGNLNPWCWVAPGAEKVVTEALRKALAAK